MSIDIERINAALSSIYHCFVYYDNPPSSILGIVKENLPEVTIEDFQEILAWGGIYVNGQRVSSEIPLVTPLKLEVYQPKIPYQQLAESFPKFTSDWIIYQDNYLAVAYKPAGLPTARPKEQQKFSMYDYLKEYHGKDIHLPSRLDYSTAGLMMYSLDARYHQQVQKLYSSREVDKRYLLKVDQDFDWKEKVVDANIGRDYRHPILRQIKSDGGKLAQTIFTNLTDQYTAGVLEAQPRTGRTHQIRVHAAQGLEAAIIGDNFYNGSIANQLNLLSYRLEFKHPITQEILSLKCPDRLLPKWLGKS